MNPHVADGRPTLVMSAVSIAPSQVAAIVDAGGEYVRHDAAAGVDDPTLREVAVWLGDGLTDALLARMPRLEWVQATSQGVENLLSGDLARSGAVVTNVRGMHSGVVAEHTLALVLALARSLPQLVRAQSEHRWLTLAGDAISVLHGSRMVVLGTGEIGRAIAARARSFEIDVVGVNTTGAPAIGFETVRPVDDLVAECASAAWLVIACPLTPRTRGIVGGDVLAALGSRGFVVNIGRGPVLDSAALRSALSSGRIAGAALDVFDEEPVPSDDPLWEMDNVLIAPHTGGIMPDYMDVAVGYFAENLMRYRTGVPLRSVVDKGAGY